MSCIISSFYIKPQPLSTFFLLLPGCIISSFYIKPQLLTQAGQRPHGCIISSFYIKPQLSRKQAITLIVVLYLHSTSNHNSYWTISRGRQVVLYLHSTSNHNRIAAYNKIYSLYYIFILHQTTTDVGNVIPYARLYYIFILHQTTTPPA